MHDQDDVADPAGLPRTQHVLEHGRLAPRQQELRSAHTNAAAGGGDDRKDLRTRGKAHVRGRLRSAVTIGCHEGLDTSEAWRNRGSAAPRFRWAISSAMMLTAISGTVCEPMSMPDRGVDLASTSRRDAFGQQVVEDQLDLPLLPIMPT